MVITTMPLLNSSDKTKNQVMLFTVTVNDGFVNKTGAGFEGQVLFLLKVIFKIN